MISLFVKILIPTAAAVGINFKQAVPMQTFAGSYQAVSGDCKQNLLTVEVDAASNSIRAMSEGQVAFLIPTIDGNSRDIEDGYQRSTYDAKAVTISSTVGNKRMMSSVLTTLTLQDKQLTIVRHESQAFSRGQGSKTETCVMTK